MSGSSCAARSTIPRTSAGRLMQTTLIAVPPFWTAGQVLDFFRETDGDVLPDNFFEVFVVDPGYRLLGTVFLDALVRAQPRARGSTTIMQADRRRVKATEDGARGGADVRALQSRLGPGRRRIRAARRRAHHRRHRRRDAGAGLRGDQGARRRESRGRADRRFLVDRRRAASPGSSSISARPSSRRACCKAFQYAAGADGGAGGAGADRRGAGRQFRDADHDRGGARARDARADPLQCAKNYFARARHRRR